MRGNNLGFYGEIRILFMIIPYYPFLSGALTWLIYEAIYLHVILELLCNKLLFRFKNFEINYFESLSG